jgi:broad specificity phosphatase PhoE
VNEVPHETVISTLRHARTAFGAERRYAGTLDVPLSEEGKRDCLRASDGLAGVEFDVVLTSPLLRAVDTARLLGCDASTLVKCDLCKERGFGVMEGLTSEEVRSLDPPVLFIEVGDDLHSVNPRGGEPFEDVWMRAKKLSRLIFREYKGLSLLVVSHGVFLQMFHGVLRGSNCIESLSTYPGNLELATFRFSGPRLVAEECTRLVAPAGENF